MKILPIVVLTLALGACSTVSRVATPTGPCARYQGVIDLALASTDLRIAALGATADGVCRALAARAGADPATVARVESTVAAVVDAVGVP